MVVTQMGINPVVETSSLSSNCVPVGHCSVSSFCKIFTHFKTCEVIMRLLKTGDFK